MTFLSDLANRRSLSRKAGMGHATAARLVAALLCLGAAKALSVGRVAAVSDELPSYSQCAVSPELFRNGSFAFAAVRRARGEAGLKIAVTIVAGRSSAAYCSLTLRPDEPGGAVAVTSLRRLDGERLALVGQEARQREGRQGFVVVLDASSCESLRLYSSPDLAERQPLVPREASGRLEVFARARAGGAACADADRAGGLETHCLPAEVDWSREVFVDGFSFSEDVLMVRAFDDAGAYRVLAYNTAVRPPRQQLWLVLPEAGSDTQVVSADLAFCWLLRAGLDEQISCVLLDKAANPRLNLTLRYEQPVKPLAVAAQSNGEPRLVVVAERARCAGQECAEVFVSSLSDRATVRRTVKLDCLANKTRLALGVRQIASKGLVALEYVCEASNRLVLHSLDVEDDG
ncbi:uncharacterized protein LOC131667137 [Phymastichus coffea]|uniref:uncharacterized protein LOC131667137 n=1 Tax=Phymastichus coffea TaxID=108790 RepID=UPI00273CBE9B|nr:uncharacterized protein LOC131667137 [Phymastichus coffea]